MSREPVIVTTRIFHLAWTLPLALAVDLVLWGFARFTALFAYSDIYENPNLGWSYLPLGLAALLIGLAVAGPDWTAWRVRRIVGIGAAVTAFAIFAALLPVTPVGPILN
jgi:hypothetical protein